jgi:hypothetical protein
MPQQRSERRRKVLLDVGGGTGNFTRALLTAMNNDNANDYVHEQWEAIVVDPYLQPNNNNDDDVDGGGGGESSTSSTKPSSLDTDSTAASKTSGGIRFVVASARDFIQTTTSTTATTTEEEEEEKCDVAMQNSDSNNNRDDNSNSNNNNNANENDKFWKSGYDCVLFKEVIHHIDPMERVAIFTRLKRGTFILSPSPYPSTTTSSSSSRNSKLTTSLLIITRPKHDINYPLWPQAYDIWSTNQPCTQQIVSDLQLAGYNNIAVQIVTYPCTVQLGQWLHMIKNRFWSTFATFTNEELYLGCEYIVKEAAGSSNSSTADVLHFEERLVFITASVV